MNAAKRTADPRTAVARPRSGRSPREPHTLVLDIGGTGLKAAVVDARGVIVGEHLRVDTPHPSPPKIVVAALFALVEPLQAYARVSIGFPGVVRNGRVITAPHLGNAAWHGFRLADTMQRKLGKPVRLRNDAEVQGCGAIAGRGLEFVITLGTGFGTALFRDGEPMPHMEFSQFPVRKKKTWDEYLGDQVFKDIGHAKWQRRVAMAIDAFRALLNFDTLYIGGGNSARLEIELPKDVRIVPNSDGLTGGIRLWEGPPRRSRA